MSRARWTAGTMLAVGLALAGCGGSSHKHTSSVAARSKLPPRAHTVFASDRSAVAGGHVLGDTGGGNVIADNGFQLMQDGFSFENYGFIAGTELDAHDMRELFGDSVCQGTPSDSCTLTYAAQQWAAQADDNMAGGHCFGFSVTALRFFRHDLSPTDFGGSTVYSLGLTPQLQSEIAYGWATQDLASVQQASQGLTPTQTIQLLRGALGNPNADAYTIGIRMPDGSGGHAITPISISDLGNGKYDINIYDNNFPGTPRAISVDTTTDTWSYQASANPADASALYQGQGQTNPMILIPLSPALGIHTCPFCTTGATRSGRGTVQVTLGGNPDQHGHLLIKTAAGGELGYVNGQFVDTIPGARVIVPFLDQDWRAQPEPVYQLPSGGPVSVTLSGQGATGHDPAAVRITGPGFGATVAGLVPQSGSVDRITIGAGGRTLAFSALGTTAAAPTVQLAGVQGTLGSQATARPSSLASGAGLKLTLAPASGHVSISAFGSTAGSPISVTVQRARGASQSVHKTSVTVAPGNSATVTAGLYQAG